MEQTQELTLEAFAEQVRQDCVTIMSRSAFGRNKEAGMLAAILCQKAADIVQRAEMERELVAGFDLSALGVWIDKPGIKE